MSRQAPGALPMHRSLIGSLPQAGRRRRLRAGSAAHRLARPSPSSSTTIHGTQTVHGLDVLADWSVAARSRPRSRSRPPASTCSPKHPEPARARAASSSPGSRGNLSAASKPPGSSSSSSARATPTLQGHFAAELERPRSRASAQSRGQEDQYSRLRRGRPLHGRQHVRYIRGRRQSCPRGGASSRWDRASGTPSRTSPAGSGKGEAPFPRDRP